MAVLSGINLAVAGIPSVSAWMVKTADENPPLVASNTKLAVNRFCSVLDWDGVIACYGHTPAYKPKDSLNFIGSLSGAVGVTGASMVTSVTIRAKYSPDARYVIIYRIAAQEPLTFGTAVASDTATPTIVCPAGNPVYVNGVPLADVVGWELRLFVTTVGYVASDTNGVKKKLAGPFDALLTIERYINTEAPPAHGTTHSVELVVEPAQGQTPRKRWQVSNLRVLEISDYGANLDLLREGERPKHTITMGLASAGAIIAPNGTQIWPET